MANSAFESVPGAEYVPESGALVINVSDGDVIVDFNPKKSQKNTDDLDFDANLADFVDQYDLNAIAADILEGVEEDRRSCDEWLQARAAGVKQLGFKSSETRSDVASSGAPLEGMSTVRSTILGEACLHFQANARRELIPSNGPVKLSVQGAQTQVKDWYANKLEREVNHYLIKKATEFVPGTDRLLFMVGFSGMAFKKVYRCPMKRRPVSEMVDAEHLVVSNNTTDIQSALRVTHIIQMNPTVFKRMQLLGVYRTEDLQPPSPDINPFDAAVARMDGVNLNVTRPEDQVRTIYEVYTDLDLPGFEHRSSEGGEPTGLPLPYRVTLDLTSRTVLEIRRDWRDGDPDFIRKRTFVPFGFAPTFGFYCTGLLQILGNNTTGLTGAWRMLLDAGMFANFPGFLYAKTGAKQSNNTFRVPPGGGAPVDVPGGMKLSDSFMPLPYKEPSPTLLALAQAIEENSRRLGGTAELPTAEGKADVPVGTMLAAIEQATKILNAVHTRLHDAQTIELELIIDLLRENPECLLRPDLQNADEPPWTTEAISRALANHNLEPRSDPNTPSHTHRLMKAVAFGTVVQQSAPGTWNPQKAAIRVCQMLQIDDVEECLAPLPPPGSEPPDPNVLKAKAAIEAAQAKLRVSEQQNQLKLADIQAKIQIEMMKAKNAQQLEHLRLLQHLVTHPLAAAIFEDVEGFGGAGIQQ